jgi:hypothetical protein
MALVPLKVYVPEKARQKLRIRAAQYGVTMSELMIRLITECPEPEAETEGEKNHAA